MLLHVGPGGASGQRVVQTYKWLFEPPSIRPARWEQGLATTALRRVIAPPDAVVLVAEDGELARHRPVVRSPAAHTSPSGKEQE
jgi:hypothetical protein